MRGFIPALTFAVLMIISQIGGASASPEARRLISGRAPAASSSSNGVPSGCASPPAVYNHQWYVDPNIGLDTNNGKQSSNGTPPNGPWKTIPPHLATESYGHPIVLGVSALQPATSGVVQGGDIIWLASGLYHTLSLANAYNTSYVTIKSLSGATPSFDQITVVGGGFWDFSGLTVTNLLSQLPSTSPGLYWVASNGYYGPINNIIIESNNLFSQADTSTWQSTDWLAKASTGVHIIGSFNLSTSSYFTINSTSAAPSTIGTIATMTVAGSFHVKDGMGLIISGVTPPEYNCIADCAIQSYSYDSVSNTTTLAYTSSTGAIASAAIATGASSFTLKQAPVVAPAIGETVYYHLSLIGTVASYDPVTWIVGLTGATAGAAPANASLSFFGYGAQNSATVGAGITTTPPQSSFILSAAPIVAPAIGDTVYYGSTPIGTVATYTPGTFAVTLTGNATSSVPAGGSVYFYGYAAQTAATTSTAMTAQTTRSFILSAAPATPPSSGEIVYYGAAIVGTVSTYNSSNLTVTLTGNAAIAVPAGALVYFYGHGAQAVAAQVTTGVTDFYGVNDGTCVTVKNNNLYNVSYGIGVSQLDKVLVSGNKINYFSDDAIDYSVSDAIFEKNYITNTVDSGDGIHHDVMQGQGYWGDATYNHDLTFRGNFAIAMQDPTLKNPAIMQGIDSYNGTWANINIYNNVVIGNVINGIIFEGSQNINIFNNTVLSEASVASLKTTLIMSAGVTNTFTLYSVPLINPIAGDTVYYQATLVGTVLSYNTSTRLVTLTAASTITVPAGSLLSIFNGTQAIASAINPQASVALGATTTFNIAGPTTDAVLATGYFDIGVLNGDYPDEESSGITIRNNIANAYNLGTTATIAFDHNIVIGTMSSMYLPPGGTGGAPLHNYSQPTFATSASVFNNFDPATYQFDVTLAPGSPAIGTGVITGAPKTDITGAARTYSIDLGAYKAP